MVGKSEPEAATAEDMAQAMRLEMKTAMNSAQTALSAALRDAKEAQRTNLKKSAEIMAKSKEELLRLLGSQRPGAENSPNASTSEGPATPNMGGALSEQMKLTEESLKAAQQGIENTLSAASRVVAEAMKYPAAPAKEAPSTESPRDEHPAPSNPRTIPRTRRRVGRRRR